MPSAGTTSTRRRLCRRGFAQNRAAPLSDLGASGWSGRHRQRTARCRARCHRYRLGRYGVPGQTGGRDFLLQFEPPSDCDTIVTNPPFRIANEFVAHALNLCPRVVMLLRLAFLESERRRSILEGRGLQRIHVFRKRLPLMHRDGWEGRKANSGMAFAWFVWNRDYGGPKIVNRISWEGSP